MALIKTLKPTGTGILTEESHTGGGASGVATLGASAAMRLVSDLDGCFLETFAGEFEEAASTARFEFGIDDMPSGFTITSIKLRAELSIDNQTAWWTPSINGVSRGVEQAITITPTWYEQEFTTDPVDGQPWTTAKLIAQTFGAYLRHACSALAVMATTYDALQVLVYGHVLADTASFSFLPRTPLGTTTLATAQVGFGADIVSLLTSAPRPPEQFQPDAVTGLIGKLKATAPASLGDEDVSTWEQQSALSGAGTLVVGATALEQLPGDPGVISHLTFNLITAFKPPGGAVDYSELRLKWTVNGVTDSYVLELEEYPIQLGPATLMNAIDSALRFRSFGPFTTQPNGGPWDAAAVDAIQDVKLEVDYDTAGGGIAGIEVAEVWAELFGPVGFEDPIEIDFAVRNDVTLSAVETHELEAPEAPITVSLRTRSNPVVKE